MIDVSAPIGQTCHTFLFKLEHSMSAQRVIQTFAFIILPVLFNVNVQAQSLTESLYSGEALVSSQSELDRQVASRSALSQALVKLSGDQSLLGEPELSALLDRAPDLISQYAYRSEVEPGPNGQANNLIYLEVVFAKEGMEQILRKLNRPVWVSQRPGAVAWLIIEDGLNLRIASSSQAAALKALTRTARNRGLKLKLPTMDNLDLSRVDAFKVWRGETAGVAIATPRYGEKVALIVRLNKIDTGWRARMTLLEKNKVIDSWSEDQIDAAGVLFGASSGAANRLASRYAVSPEDLVAGLYRVEFSAIENADDYANLMGYLKSLSVVSGVFPTAASSQKLFADLSLEVSLERFAKVLAMDEQLQTLDDQTFVPDAQAAVQVRYQLLH